MNGLESRVVGLGAEVRLYARLEGLYGGFEIMGLHVYDFVLIISAFSTARASTVTLH